MKTVDFAACTLAFFSSPHRTCAGGSVSVCADDKGNPLMPPPALLAVALGIVWRADIAPTELHADHSAYPSAFAFPEKGSCAGTLISEGYALTAAHCFPPNENHPLPMSITLGSGYTAKVSARFLNPCFDFDKDGPNGVHAHTQHCMHIHACSAFWCSLGTHVVLLDPKILHTHG